MPSAEEQLHELLSARPYHHVPSTQHVGDGIMQAKSQQPLTRETAMMGLQEVGRVRGRSSEGCDSAIRRLGGINSKMAQMREIVAQSRCWGCKMGAEALAAEL